MTVVNVTPGDVLGPGPPRVLFDIAADLHIGTSYIAPYDVAPDGQRFLFVRRQTKPLPPPPSQMRVVLSWFGELKAKVGG